MANRYVEALKAGKLSRREFGRVLASVGLSMAVLPLLPAQSRAAGKINVFTWGGYDIPEVIPAYVAKHGGTPDYSLFSSEEEALQKMIAGFNPDLMHPCSYNIKRWYDAGVLAPFDTAKIPEYENLWERFRTIPQTSFDGKTYFIPWDAGTASVGYRTDMIDPADVANPSWSLLFNEKYKGKLSMYDTDTTFVEIACRVMGIYADYQHLNDDQLAKVKEMLVKQRDLMKFYWGDNTQIEQAIKSGEVAAAYLWSGSYATLKNEGVPVDYMIPKEGILGYSCGLVRHAKAPGDEQAAYDFVNAFLDPESGKYLIETLGYFHSNRRTYKIVDPQILSNMGASDPEATFKAMALDPEPEEPYRSKYIELVNNVKSGL
jgi:spermidine/putrescine transport system substrate-binding protein